MSKQSNKKQISRRDFLRMAGYAGGTALLTACGVQEVAPEATDVPESAVEPTAVPTVVTPQTRDVTLTYWHPRSHSDADAEEAYHREMIALFEEENPGIKVEWVPQSWGDIYTKWVTAIESGNVPDITMSGAEAMIQFAAQGAVASVDDVAERLGGVENFMPGANNYVWENQIWGLPYSEGAELLFYREDLLEEAGFGAAPQTWDELLEVAQALTTADRYGLDVYYSKSFWTIQHIISMMKGADGGILGTDGRPMYTAPENVEAHKFYISLLQEHEVVPPSRVADVDWNAVTLPAYGDDRLGMFIFFPPQFRGLQTQFPEMAERTGIAMIPAGPSGHSGSFGINNTQWIFADSPNVEEAKLYLEFMQTRPAVVPRAQLISFLSGGKNGTEWIMETPELANDPLFQAVIEQMPTAVRVGFPHGAHPANGEVEGQMIPAETVQEIVVNGVPVEEALEQTQARLEEIYSAS